MKSSEIVALLRPFKSIINPRALSPMSRVIEIGPKLRANCEWAHVECAYDAQQSPVFVDGASFCAVLDSLNNGEEFKQSLADNVLSWRCGHAQGKFATVPEIEMPAYSRRVKAPWRASDEFKKALQLGMLSAGSSALATVGLFGVSIKLAKQRLAVMSSDNITISYAEASDAKATGPAVVTLSPDGADLLATLLQGTTTLEMDDKAVYVSSPTHKARINQIDAIKSTIGDTLAAFEAAEIQVKLPRERIAAFVKRASALAEAKRHTTVWISAKKGKLTTTFSEGISTTEEDYLIEGLDVPDLAPSQVDASKLARALSSSDVLVLDHVDRNVLVLHGEKPKFRYLIAARKQG